MLLVRSRSRSSLSLNICWWLHVSRRGGHTFVNARLETGRTHQIRVHFAYMKHSVVGDPVYGQRKPSLPLKRQFLHAYKLGFKLPTTGEYREFEAPLPADLAAVLAKAEQLS